MKKIDKYIVRTIGNFGGFGVEVFEEYFNNYEEATAYYKAEVEKVNHQWKYDTPKVIFIDGIAKAEKELADLKMMVTELETAIKIAKEN